MGDMEPEELAVRRLVRDEGGAAVDVVEEIVEVERPAHDLGRVPAKVRVLAERRRGIMPEQHRDALRRFEEGRVAGQLDLDAALMLAREEGSGRIDPVEVEHVQRIRGVQRLDIAFHIPSHPKTGKGARGTVRGRPSGTGCGGRGRGLELGGLRDVAALLGGAVGGGDCCGGLGLRVGRLGVHLGLVGLARGLDGL